MRVVVVEVVPVRQVVAVLEAVEQVLVELLL
jgi:hypothetical protein